MDFLPIALEGLSKFPQFIIYQLLPSDSRPGKTDKIPIDPIRRYKINHLSPESWMTAEEAITYNHILGVGYGVGFVFTKDDPYFFIDIDDCLSQDNSWSALSLEIASHFPGASIEISSSGKGLHIIGRGHALEHACKSSTYANIEFYTQQRFVALTGTSAIGNVDTVHDPALVWLTAQYFPVKNTISDIQWTTGPCVQWHGPTDDETLLKRMLASHSANAIFGNKASFKELWECDIPALSRAYPDKYRDRAYDESSADMALAQHLAYWTGNNCERILILMLQSKLVREKWQREDYLKSHTIIKACGMQTRWLQDKSMVAEDAPIRNSFPSLDQQKEIFKGCVYVRDAHRILIPGGELLKPDQFRATYGGYSFVMDALNQRVTRNAWEVFTESQVIQFPQAQTSCFRPDLSPAELIKEDERVLVNLWWPISTRRVAGDITLFTRHLSLVLPDANDQLILLSYLAACVQHPGIKFQWAPLIQGVDGNGKTLFSRCVAYAVGRRYTHLPNAKEITEKYNDWLYGKIFIGVEDIYVDPDLQIEVLETLKPMITGEYIAIRAMYSPQEMRRVCGNFILNTNHKNGLRKTRNDRRFAPFFTAQQSKEDLIRDGLTQDYFMNLYHWLEQRDGYAIVNEYLHTYKILDQFNPAHKQPAPVTSTTHDAIEQGLGGVEQEIQEAIEQQLQGFKNGWISSLFLDRLLDRLNASRKIPRSKRRELLQNLGYDWHPALPSGRVAIPILPDNGRPTLYIHKESPAVRIDNPVEVTKNYTIDQTK